MPSEKHIKWIRSGPLYLWRTGKELTQSEAAHKVGASLMTWQLWERGLGAPNSQNLKALIDMTGLEALTVAMEHWKKRGVEG